jgi:hypothetical protein
MNEPQEDDIRKPDEVKKEKLIDNSFDNEDDIEINLALDMSKREYFNIDQNAMDDDFELALKLSEKEYYDEQLEEINKNEFILMEEMNNRKKSLESFSKKIERLTYTEEDIFIRKYIQNILNNYYDLMIDYVNIENEIYDKIYKIIDTYYLIPTSKKFSKTSISKEEDELIRNIFRKQN